MAKIVLLIEDRDDGTVHIFGDCSDGLAIFARAGHAQARTRAETHAMATWNAMRTLSEWSGRPGDLHIQ